MRASPNARTSLEDVNDILKSGIGYRVQSSCYGVGIHASDRTSAIQRVCRFKERWRNVLHELTITTGTSSAKRSLVSSVLHVIYDFLAAVHDRRDSNEHLAS